MGSPAITTNGLATMEVILAKSHSQKVELARAVAVSRLKRKIIQWAVRFLS